MLLKIEKFYKLLQDPLNSDVKLKFKWKNKKISSIIKKKNLVKFINKIPILIDFSNSVLNKNIFKTLSTNNSLIGKKKFFLRKLKSYIFGTYFNSKKSFDLLESSLRKNSTILILGGGNIGTGLDKIYGNKQINIIATDIYPSNSIQFISDCHNIPLKNKSVDGVIIQAVLEHVLDPNQVVSEIYRVLKNDGLVLAETPFMQHSHEEPYDFTRFTELGHRWLFKSFKSLYRKTNGGPGLSLFWSVKSTLFSLINIKIISNLLSTPFIIFVFLDFLIPEKRKIKSANGFIFLGKKSKKKISKNNILKEFIG